MVVPYDYGLPVHIWDAYGLSIHIWGVCTRSGWLICIWTTPYRYLRKFLLPHMHINARKHIGISYHNHISIANHSFLTFCCIT